MLEDAAVLKRFVRVGSPWRGSLGASPKGSGTRPDVLAVERKLQALRKDCGCTVGMVVLVISMAAYLTYFLPAHAAAYTTWQKVGFGVGTFFGSALSGKLVGLGIARYRYSRLRRKTRDMWRTATSPLAN